MAQRPKRPPEPHRAPRTPPTAAPSAKLPETLIAFAKPLLDLVPAPPTADRVRTMMTLATIAWNLPIYVRAGRPDAADFRATLAAGLAEAGPRAKVIVADLMIARLTRHAAEARTVVVTVRAGGEGEEPVVVEVGAEE